MVDPLTKQEETAECQCVGPCVARRGIDGRVCKKLTAEREFTDAVINAIGDISVMEAQAAIAKWRQEHAHEY